MFTIGAGVVEIVEQPDEAALAAPVCLQAGSVETVEVMLPFSPGMAVGGPNSCVTMCVTALGSVKRVPSQPCGTRARAEAYALRITPGHVTFRYGSGTLAWAVEPAQPAALFLGDLQATCLMVDVDVDDMCFSSLLYDDEDDDVDQYDPITMMMTKTTLARTRRRWMRLSSRSSRPPSLPRCSPTMPI
jgi:hypothetical protein